MKSLQTIILAAGFAIAGATCAYAQLGPSTEPNNGTTATVVNKLAIQGGSNTLTVATTSSTTGVVGLINTGAGTTGSPQLITWGTGYCVFDGTPSAAGDYVQASTSSGGECHDAGSTEPTSGDILGRVHSTTSVGGNYPVDFQITPAAPSGSAPAFNTITTGTNTTTLTMGTGGALTFSGTGTINANELGGVALLGGTLTNTDFCTYASSGTLLNCNTGSTGSGNVVLATSPTLTTPALGTPSSATLTNATGLPVGGIASIATNTIVANVTSGSASPTATSVTGCSAANDALIWTTNTGPGCSTSLMSLSATGQSFTGGVTYSTSFSIGTVTTGTTTLNCGNGPSQWMANGGASTIAAPTTDSACNVKVINGGSFGTITFSGFREGSNTGDTVPTADRGTGTATFTNSSASIGLTNTLAVNDPVYFTNSGGALPTNFTSGTVYYVISTGLSTSNIEVAATPGGSAITAGSAGTGTQTGHEASSYTLSISRIDGLSKYLVSADQ